VTAEEQRLLALVLTDDAARERCLRNDGTIVGIEGTAIRRFAASLARKRRHRSRHTRRAGFEALFARLLGRLAALFRY